jgi:hypothetical protein
MRIWMFTYLLAICLPGTSQYILKGTIVDSAYKPINGLVLKLVHNNPLYRKNISMLSDKHGSFVFTLTEAGKYQLKCSSIFYKDTVIHEINIADREMILDTIKLCPLSASLQHVEVSVRKKIFESDAGKRIYNVSADPTVTGLSAIEVINNIPGITATEEGPVLFRGTGEAVLLVNGRKVPGTPGQYLAQLASHAIERIEVSDNTSQFNAQNDGVLVNIILKQAAINEWRGFFSTQLGYPLKQVSSLSVIHNRKKMEFSFDVGTTLHQHPNEDFYQRTTEYNGKTNVIQSNSISTGKHFTRKLHAGLVWKPDSSFNYRISIYEQLWPDESTGHLSRITSVNNSITNEQKNIYSSKDNFDNTFMELQQALSKKLGRKWLVSLNLDMNKGSDGSNNQTLFPVPYNSSDYDHRNKKELQSELVYTINDNRIFKMGAQLANSMINAGASFNEGSFMGSYIIQTDYFTKAAYLAGDMKFKTGFYMNAAIRYEYFSIDAAINGSAKNNIQSTEGFFPTMIAGYKQGRNELRILSRRSIRRPAVFSLIPVTSLFSNKFDQVEANLFVLPTITEMYELSYSHNFEKNGMLNISFFTRFGKNEFEDIFSYTAEGNSQRKLQNIGRKNSVGFDINYNVKYLKAVTSNLNIIAGFDKFNNSFLYNQQTRSVSVNLNNTFQLNKSITAKLTMLHRFTRKTIWTVNQPVTVVNLVLSYQFTNKRAVVTADVTDIFLGNVARGYRYVPGGFETFSNWWDTRLVRVGFSYRFGKLNKEVNSNLRGE